MRSICIAFVLLVAADAAQADACEFVKRTLWPSAPYRELALYPDELASKLIPAPWAPSEAVSGLDDRTIHWQKESIFDFNNDGMVDRVLLSSLDSRYLTGSVVLVEHGASSTSFVPRDAELGAAWLLPCQLDETHPKVKECPPFSQRSDGAELRITKVDGSTSVFPVRYSQVIPFVFEGKTHLAIQTSSGRDGERGIGVLKTKPDQSVDALCVVHGNSITRAVRQTSSVGASP